MVSYARVRHLTVRSLIVVILLLIVAGMVWWRGVHQQTQPPMSGIPQQEKRHPNNEIDARLLASDYMPILETRMSSIGIELTRPESSKRKRPKAVYQKRPGRSAEVLNVFCRLWDVALTLNGNEVIYFSNSDVLEKEYQEHQLAVTEGTLDELQYDRPQISLEQATQVFFSRDWLKEFGVQRSASDFAEPEISFHPRPERRGWHFVMWRSHSGYRFRDEGVWLIIHDKTEELVYFNNLTSDVVPVVPSVRVNAKEVAGRVKNYFAGDAHFMKKIRATGFPYDPEKLVIQDPIFVHANSTFEQEKVPDHSFDFPLHLAFVCHVESIDKAGSRYKIELWVDAETGSVVGGDYSFTRVVASP